MKAWFAALADAVCDLSATTGPAGASGFAGTASPGGAGGPGGQERGNPTPVHRITLSLQAEDSDFVRFNRGAIRQLTHVEQREATVALVSGQRRAVATTTLSGQAVQDIPILLRVRAELAADLTAVPPDPHLRPPPPVNDTHRDDTPRTANDLPPVAAIVEQVTAQAAGLDLVAFYAAGPVILAFADSRGQRNWHRVRSFHLEWSLYVSGDAAMRDRAVKSVYAGAEWDAAEFQQRMDLARRRLAPLQRPSRKIEPGSYRSWLEPMAVAEMLGMLAWGGFGIKSRRTGTSSLLALENGEAELSPQFSLTEAVADGIAPAFTATGETRPGSVALVAAGKAAEVLVSPRSAAEFGVAANAADGEYPTSLRLAGGALAPAAALAALDTGLWIGNLWYLNYSDRRQCRMTGMTRFASFWVEKGKIVAPIEVMRFDDSFLRLFGGGLLALSQQVELLPANETYGRRHLGSVSTPGALLADMRFTL